MNYELAVKLKNAGFPQPRLGAFEGSITSQGFKGRLEYINNNSEVVYIPTLEEAVANLWLELNKKLNKNMNCKYCENLEEMGRECPDGPYHGVNMLCEECGAEYYEEYGGKVWACNDEALKSHPELKKL